MKRVIAVMFIAALMLSLHAAPASAWTGRMGGMGNPYGLMEDESDFLTHPTGIAQGKGLNFYGDLSLSRKDVSKWDVSVGSLDTNVWDRKADGDEWNTDTRLGFALPVGSGRMGVFLEYNGNFISRGGKYDGSGSDYLSTTAGRLAIRNDYDAAALRILYAQPISNGKARLGGELSIGYVSESNYIYTETNAGTLWVRDNYHWDWNFLNGFLYGLPYSSQYWEAKMKGSLEASIGTSKLNVTPFGSFIVDGNNRYDWDFGANTPWLWGKHKGDVKGYNIGGEAWLRLPVNSNLSVPVLAKVVYSEKKRDGGGVRLPASTFCDYENKEKALNIEAGAGIDAQIAKGSRFAAGLYYGHTDSKNDFAFSGESFGWVDYSSNPKLKEDRITLRLAGEKEISPKITLNGGLSYYFGWVQNYDFEKVRNDGEYYNLSLDGRNWGGSLSVGAAIKLNGLTFEPYLKGAYQDLKTSGDGTSSNYATESGKYAKRLWTVGGGFSVNF